MSATDNDAAARRDKDQQREIKGCPSWWPIELPDPVEPPGRGVLLGFVVGTVFGALAMCAGDHRRLRIEVGEPAWMSLHHNSVPIPGSPSANSSSTVNSEGNGPVVGDKTGERR